MTEPARTLLSPKELAERVAPANDSDILTPEEAAALLRINVKTLYDLVGKVPWAKKLGPKVIRCSRSALLRWFETQDAEPKKRR